MKKEGSTKFINIMTLGAQALMLGRIYISHGVKMHSYLKISPFLVIYQTFLVQFNERQVRVYSNCKFSYDPQGKVLVLRRGHIENTFLFYVYKILCIPTHGSDKLKRKEQNFSVHELKSFYSNINYMTPSFFVLGCSYIDLSKMHFLLNNLFSSFYVQGRLGI